MLACGGECRPCNHALDDSFVFTDIYECAGSMICAKESSEFIALSPIKVLQTGAGSGPFREEKDFV
jgi:hypothetical protein